MAHLQTMTRLSSVPAISGKEQDPLLRPRSLSRSSSDSILEEGNEGDKLTRNLETIRLRTHDFEQDLIPAKVGFTKQPIILPSPQRALMESATLGDGQWITQSPVSESGKRKAVSYAAPVPSPLQSPTKARNFLFPHEDFELSSEEEPARWAQDHPEQMSKSASCRLSGTSTLGSISEELSPE